MSTIPIRTSILALLAASGVAAGQPGGSTATMKLTGAVFDFQDDDPDFTTPSTSASAGAVAAALDESGVPIYKGSGEVIVSSATDKEGRPIAAHMVNPFAPADLPADEPVILADAWGNAAYAINLNGVTYNDDGTSTWSYHVEELDGGKDLSHWNLALDSSHEVLAGTTPGYELGVDGSTGFYGIKWNVDDGFHSGDFEIVLDKQYDAAIRESGVLAKGGNKADTESILAPSAEEVPSGGGGGCVAISDLPATLGDADGGGIGSMGSFSRWYTFLPGTNLPGAVSIILTETDDGVFEFTTEDFRPIDGDLYGNDASGANRDFTMHITAEFEHADEVGRFFSYSGQGDCWVFIDGKLMIDLTGAAGGASQVADIDRLCLEPGTHTLDLFYAQRGEGGQLELSTNLSLSTRNVGPPASVALHD